MHAPLPAFQLVANTSPSPTHRHVVVSLSADVSQDEGQVGGASLLRPRQNASTPALQTALSAHPGGSLAKAQDRRRVVLDGCCVEVVACGVQSLPDFAASLRRALGTCLADARAQRLNVLDIELALDPNVASLESQAENATGLDLTACVQVAAEALGLALYVFKTWSNTLDAQILGPLAAPFGAPVASEAHKGARSTEGRTSAGRASASTPTPRIASVVLRLPAGALPSATLTAALTRGLARAQACNFARYLGDLPANALTPDTLASAASKRLEGLATVSILDEHALAAQGFGGLIAVGKGSNNPPRLVVAEVTPTLANLPGKTIVLVGKGVTFDTGGYSIKGKAHHNEMKYDMCGAANVIAALEILAYEKPPVRIVAILACVENMVSANAQRPGDVYRAWNGKTIEVYNTDAEGRLVLADALAFAQTFKPSAIADVATLTGGATQIAGNMAGIVCTSLEASVEPLRKAALRAGERFIHLEILPEAITDMKSQCADYTNMHSKWASGAPTMYAAAFLKEFVPQGVPWVHLDIANVAWNARETGYLPTQGATSYGARTLVEWVWGQIGDLGLPSACTETGQRVEDL